MSEAETEEKTGGEKLVEGLKRMMDEQTPDDEKWCPNCEHYAEFIVLQTVARPEFGVENDVIGCPDCRHTTIAATEWRPLEGGVSNGE